MGLMTRGASESHQRLRSREAQVTARHVIDKSRRSTAIHGFRHLMRGHGDFETAFRFANHGTLSCLLLKHCRRCTTSDLGKAPRVPLPTTYERNQQGCFQNDRSSQMAISSKLANKRLFIFNLFSLVCSNTRYVNNCRGRVSIMAKL
jgi:hypothetical protein